MVQPAVIFRFKLTKSDLVSQKSSWSIYCSFARCIIISFDFQIESELVWFNFRGNGTSFLVSFPQNTDDIQGVAVY